MSPVCIDDYSEYKKITKLVTKIIQAIEIIIIFQELSNEIVMWHSAQHVYNGILKFF